MRELRSLYHEDLDQQCEGWSSGTTWRQIYNQYIFCVRYDSTIGKRVIKDRPYKYEGYVGKRTISDFEVHEIEEINSWLSHEEYEALPENKKKLYQFYQWDEPFDEYNIYRTIYERLCAMLYWFDFADAFEDKCEYWNNEPGLSDIRLFIERT